MSSRTVSLEFHILKLTNGLVFLKKNGSLLIDLFSTSRLLRIFNSKRP